MPETAMGRPASAQERHELLKLYLPIIKNLTAAERLLIVSVLKHGTSEQVATQAAWCRAKISEIQRVHEEKEA